jgi:hypothetical protein
MAVDVDGVLLPDVKHQHIVLAHVEGVLHDGRGFFDLADALSYAQQTDAIDSPGYHKGDAHDKYHQY